MIRNRYIFVLLLLAVIILHLNFVLPTALTKMYYGDEVVFIECSKSVLQNGVPFLKQGQTQPISSCLWHPPLYIYSLSAMLSIFGENLIALRAVSIVFNVLTIILVYLVILNLLRDSKHKKWWALLASGLYALNPLTIQSSIVLDIDGGILNFFVMLFIFLYLKLDHEGYFYLAIPLFFVFWSKFTGVIILFCSFFLFFLINKKWKEIVRLFMLFSAAGLVFLYSFFIYCRIFGLDFAMPFYHSSFLSYLRFMISEPFIWIAKVLWILKIFVYFITPFFTLLFLSGVFLLIKQEINKRRIEDVNGIFGGYNEVFPFAIVALFVILFYSITGSTGWNFPKYYILAIAPMTIACCFIMAKVFKNAKFVDKKFAVIVLITSMLIIFYFLIFLRDPIIPEISGVVKTTSFSQAFKLIAPRFLMYFLVPLALSSMLIYKLPKGKRVIYILFYLTLLMFVYIAFIQVFADYSTHNLYGNRGLEETIGFLKENSIAAENIAAYSHIGYYLNSSEFLDVMFVYNSPELFKEKVIDNPAIEYLIILDKDIERIGKEGMDSFILEQKIGDYLIYEKK